MLVTTRTRTAASVSAPRRERASPLAPLQRAQESIPAGTAQTGCVVVAPSRLQGGVHVSGGEFRLDAVLAVDAVAEDVHQLGEVGAHGSHVAERLATVEPVERGVDEPVMEPGRLV